MSPHSPLCQRPTWRLCRMRRLQDRRINGPPAMRTRSRTTLAAKAAPALAPAQVAKAAATASQTGTITKKTSTKRQLLASEKRLGRKRLQLKQQLERKKRDMEEDGKTTFGISHRIRLLTDMGPVGQLGRKFLVPVQRRITSPEEMTRKRESKRVGKSRLVKTW
jgi:hypothetical protein